MTVLRAELLGSPKPNTPDWYALRRAGITATDLPQILGLSAYGNALTVWHDKQGDLPPGEPSEAGLWGHLLEDPVAQEWARRTGNTVSQVGVLAHQHEPWMRASCDRLIDGTNAALEVKTRSAYKAGLWRDDIPDDVLAQVAWQRVVGQFDYVDVACLIGGQSLTTYRYEKDTELEDYLREAAVTVWHAVTTKIPPPVDMDAVLLKLLDRLYPDRSGIRTIPPDQGFALVNAYQTACTEVKFAEERKDAAKAAAVLALGDADVLQIDGWDDEGPVFTYRQQEKNSVSVRDLEANDPELYLKVLEGGHINTTTSRVLRTGKGATHV
jgi:putative phage-type endonuclease